LLSPVAKGVGNGGLNINNLKGIARELVALRIANEIPDGSYVNLGIGIPTLVSNWIGDRDLILQAEIGMLNCGPIATDEAIDQDCINASCQPITELPDRVISPIVSL